MPANGDFVRDILDRFSNIRHHFLRFWQEVGGANGKHGKIRLIDDFNPKPFFITDEFHLPGDFLEIRILIKRGLDVFFNLFKSLLVRGRSRCLFLLFGHLTRRGFGLIAACLSGIGLALPLGLASLRRAGFSLRILRLGAGAGLGRVPARLFAIARAGFADAFVVLLGLRLNALGGFVAVGRFRRGNRNNRLHHIVGHRRIGKAIGFANRFTRHQAGGTGNIAQRQ